MQRARVFVSLYLRHEPRDDITAPSRAFYFSYFYFEGLALIVTYCERVFYSLVL